MDSLPYPFQISKSNDYLLVFGNRSLGSSHYQSRSTSPNRTLFTGRNEMVSLGDTAISLHILQPPLGGVFWKVKTQSAKICLNFKFLGGGCSGKSNPKCQDLPKFQFFGGGSGKSKPKVPRSA